MTLLLQTLLFVCISGPSYSFTNQKALDLSFTKIPQRRLETKPEHQATVLASDCNSMLTRFGLISDTQYADADDAPNYVGNRLRRYRQSLNILCTAVHHWNSMPEREERPIDFAVELGDMFDAKAKSARWKCLADVKGVLDLATWKPPRSYGSTNEGPVGRWHCCIGNHELYCFTREELQREIFHAAPAPRQMYYDFSPTPGLRFVVLDGYDVSTIAASDGEASTRAAREFLYEQNYNINDQNIGGGGEWLLGVIGNQRRFLPYNGALGKAQLEWFEGVLLRAQNGGSGRPNSVNGTPVEKVVVFCHMPIYAACSNFNNLLWNYETVQKLLAKYPDVVVAWFAGHDHDGGYAVDPQTGVHHIIPCAPLECAPGEVSFGHVDVYADHLEVTWVGKTPAHGPSDTGLKEPWPRVLAFRKPLSDGGAFAVNFETKVNEEMKVEAGCEEAPHLRARL